MATIIYGVSGEGSGHAVRSREVIRHLIKQGHRLYVVTYGRAYNLLGSEFPSSEVFGLHMDYQHNAIRYLSSIWKNLIRAPSVVTSLGLVADLFRSLRPDIVCTDFEPLTVLTALRFGVPIVSIDNIHHVVFGESHVPWRYRHDRLVAKAVVRLMVPHADRYVIISFTPLTVKNRTVKFVPPILRSSILAANPSFGEHILVYDSFGNERIPEMLRFTDQMYRLYGYQRVGHDGKLHFRQFSEDSFFEDLVTCRAVIGTGGFTLISESIALKKPYLALPIVGQFEQIDNALELERLGYGMMLKTITPGGILRFINKLDIYGVRLASYIHPGNNEAMTFIENLVNEFTLLRRKPRA